MRGAWSRALAVVAAMGVLVSGCAGAEPVDAARAQRVVVAVGVPFLSLNAATATGRAPGSSLVRGLAQDGFVTLDETGETVPDPQFGTVEKIAESPLAVRYTIGPDATWSDGVRVTSHDLLLEWAARSGELDDVLPKIGADGSISNVAELDAGVGFAATSPALVMVEKQPEVDAQDRVTITYEGVVPDWQVALDVNAPAHVIGREALGITDPQAAAQAVTKAIQDLDKAALSKIARAWRSAGEADVLAEQADSAVSCGPYRISTVLPDESVELVRNEHYAGSRPAKFERVVVRSDLHPLDQAKALLDGDIDVAAPADTVDVYASLVEQESLDIVTGGDSAWQFQPETAHGGPFDAATYGGDEDKAALVRRAFFATVPRDAIVAELVAVVAPGQHSDTAVLPTVGTDAGGAVQAHGAADVDAARALLAEAGVTGTVRVRLLANTTDPARAAAMEMVTASAAEAGFEIVPYTPVLGPTADLWEHAEAWDLALVPEVQAELPIDSVVSRWGVDGATNVTGWKDEKTDAIVRGLAVTTNPAETPLKLDDLARRLGAQAATLPITHAPAVTVTRGAAKDGYPDVGHVGLLALSRADLSSWWAWATAAAGSASSAPTPASSKRGG